MFRLRSQRGAEWRRVQPIMASNPAWRRGLQSWRPVGRVAELGSLATDIFMEARKPFEIEDFLAKNAYAGIALFLIALVLLKIPLGGIPLLASPILAVLTLWRCVALVRLRPRDAGQIITCAMNFLALAVFTGLTVLLVLLFAGGLEL